MGANELGSLVIAGSGIKLLGHMTLEVQATIKQADKVLYVVNESAMARWITRLNPTAESLHTLYAPGKPRPDTYTEMVSTILGQVRQGKKVCAVFYGHPGVFVNPGWEAIRQARAEGHEAFMLPGISAEDCLFVDLGLDPAQDGCQSYEATDFLLRPRRFDPTVPLILWQVGVVGERGIPGDEPSRHGLAVLADVLEEQYGPEHEVILYEATLYPIVDPTIITVTISELAAADFTPIATLYVPPLHPTPTDETMYKRLFPNGGK
ncbi:MAG: SAM-dependent methyltransferase [Candidatus Promineifilaceae bacterium]